MTAVLNYQDLLAWKKAMDLAERSSRLTESFPRREIYGLASDIRDSAVSVPSNVAEGQGRRSTREFLHHLSIAHGSLRELETQFLLAGRLGYVREEDLAKTTELAGEVGRLINGLYNSLVPSEQ